MILDEDLPQNVRRTLKAFSDTYSRENEGSRVTYQPQSDMISHYILSVLDSFPFNGKCLRLKQEG